MPTFNINSLTYQIVPATSSAETPLYDLTFTIPSTGAPNSIRYRKDDVASVDSGFIAPSGQTVPYSYTFTSLTETDIEGLWILSWKNTSGSSQSDGEYVIPNSAITSTTDTGGLTTASTEVALTLTGDTSPYVVKNAKLSKLSLALETFSQAAEYNPLKTYNLPTGARAIMLTVNDYVPSSFGGSGREDWILYSLIIENRAYPITPKNRPGAYPIIYHLNSSLVGPVRAVREANNEGFIDTDSGKITKVGIKVELGRPNDQASSTPIIFGYKLKYIDYE